jgi:N-acetylglucosaminyldiphosphoundecaprenol N-acetyl-beta-D-mannosaminyltransferase
MANVHVLVSACHDEQLRRALATAHAVFPDGEPVAWVQRRIGHVSSRIAGPDLMPYVIERGQDLKLRHFLLGSTNDVLRRLQQSLDSRYPTALIVGAYSPSRDEIETEGTTVADRIKSCEADVIWCAFGAPRQELWMAEHASKLSSSVLVGVGAAFDFLAGTKARAPIWMQRAGLEWLHRLGQEPSRLATRYLRTNGEFIVRAVADLARR